MQVRFCFNTIALHVKQLTYMGVPNKLGEVHTLFSKLSCASAGFLPVQETTVLREN